MDKKEVLDKHKKHLFPAVKNFYQDPLVAVEAKGATVTDIEGNQYLDFFGGILTISVGHAHPEVNAAIMAQLSRISHITTLYPTLPIVELAERLASITPGNLEKCFFTASGTEADETAVIMAQCFTGNQEIIGLRHGYSGRSLLAQALTAHNTWRAIPTQVAAVKHAPSPYCYRCPFKLSYPSCGVACAKDLDELIQTTTTGRIAGMLAEPIQGVGGFIVPPKEYFEIATTIVRKYGGVFISDEVQTGFGRTGKMWGIEQFNVEPDMMTMAKGIANGLPLGALITTGPIADSLTKNTISTFGGNPVSCAAANATIGIIQRDDLTENAEKMGRILREGLEGLKRDYPQIIGDVRGMGLMQALEFVYDETIKDRTPNPQATALFLEETRKQRLLVGRGGLYGNVIRISPPLNINQDQVQDALQKMRAALKAMN
ncbi:MAG: aspartate aminotransferase family protein [Acidobacteria bacterium]|nr:aspartate aminotransferase family protein [Acidobacteriota bacterium]MCB9397091.1 aspartate aminotransferase family protein [Acidobacteriota bacterium]